MNFLQRWSVYQVGITLLSVYITFFSVWIFHASALSSLNISKNAPKGEWLHALPGYTYSFPRDHGTHDKYNLEWWYFTGNLWSQSGQRFGYETTFFRKGITHENIQNNSSRWAIDHLYFGHLALTDVETHSFHFKEKLSRAGLGKAGAYSDQMSVWIDRWSLQPVTADHQILSLKAVEGDIGLNLNLNLQKQPVIHGRGGISRKGAKEGQTSHYYSLTRLDTKGEIVIGNKKIKVSGFSWMDHEFGSGELGEGQVGWDWFSVQFDNKMELMVYLLRKRDGSPDPASSGTLIFPDGRSQHLLLQEIEVKTQSYWTSPHTRAKYPAQWVLSVPSVQLSVHIMPVLADQELRTSQSTQVDYWEGAVDVNGRYQGNPVQGVGYVELTGYSKSLSMDGK